MRQEDFLGKIKNLAGWRNLNPTASQHLKPLVGLIELCLRQNAFTPQASDGVETLNVGAPPDDQRAMHPGPLPRLCTVRLLADEWDERAGIPEGGFSLHRGQHV